MPGVYILGEGDLVQTQGHAKASSRGHTHTVRITMTKSRHQNMIFGRMALESRCWWYSVCCMKLIKDMFVRCIRTGGSTQIHLTAWEHSCRSRNAWGGGSHHSQYINIWLRRHHHLLRTTQAVHIRLPQHQMMVVVTCFKTDNLNLMPFPTGMSYYANLCSFQHRAT